MNPLGALQTGGTQVMPLSFDPQLMLQLFEEEHGTIVLGMLDDPSLPQRDVASWRLALMGGAPVPPELVRRAAQLVPGLKVAIGYGQTESSPYLTHSLPDDPHPDWIATDGQTEAVRPRVPLTLSKASSASALRRWCTSTMATP
jgi:fatty-acyl-CoA synthase